MMLSVNILLSSWNLNLDIWFSLAIPVAKVRSFTITILGLLLVWTIEVLLSLIHRMVWGSVADQVNVLC